MSLKIWLPLNNSLVNQGTSPAKFTSTGSNWTYGAGKVTSKCMTCPATPSSSTASNYIGTTTTFKYKTDFSVSVWVKLPSANSSYTSYIATEGRADAGGYGWGLSGNSTSITFRFGNTGKSVSSLTAGTWHIATMTVNSSSLCSYYLDGVLKGTFTPSTLPTYAEDSGIGLGCFYYASGKIYPWNGSINDFRLYDHCLSLKEVKQLARGLMVHYPLSRPGDNLYLNSTTGTTYGFNAGTNITHSHSITNSSVGEITFNITANTSTSTSTAIGPFITFSNGGFTTNGTTYTTSFECWCNHNASFTMLGTEGGGNTGASTILANQWTKIVKTGTRGSSTSQAFVMYGKKDLWIAGTIFKIRKIKIEYGSKVTPWIPGRNDSIYSKFPFYKGNLVASKSSQTIGSSSSTGQYVYATINPTAGGNYKAQTHRVRFNVTVNAGTVTQVTVLFYNLSSSTGNTRVDATIVNGMVDIFITPTAAVPNLLIYAGVAGSTANKGITISNLVVYDSFKTEDNSGYGNNATSVNITSIDMNTARYLSCPVFNGSSGHIYLPKGTGRPTDAITVSVWAYMSDWTTFAGRILSCTEGGGWNFEPNGSTKIAFAIGTGISSNTYKTVASTTTREQLGSGWHHFVGTYDGLQTKIYIDGNLDNTLDAYSTATPIYYANNYTFVGAEAGGNTTTPAGSYFNGKISDVRIYATALSATDVKELYESAASIDKNGNMHCYELIEN